MGELQRIERIWPKHEARQRTISAVEHLVESIDDYSIRIPVVHITP